MVERIGYRLILLFLLFLSQTEIVLAQKKAEQIIPDAEKRKILRARKLFNEFKIYEGERILKDLVHDHPNEAYYHEALVQLQHQVLGRLNAASVELQSYNSSLLTDSTNNSGDDDDYALHETQKANQLVAKKDSVEVEWNGLDTGPRKEDKKELRKKNTNEEEESAINEAVVTIDSSLIHEDFDEDGLGLPKKQKKINSSLAKKLKALSDLAQIPYDAYKLDLIQNCRRATLQVEFADSASAYLRQLLVDTLNPDIRAGDLAVEAYENGLDELNGNDQVSAVKYFNKAIELFADYYAAYLHLGDAYSFLGKDSDVIRKYNDANLLQPTKPEPLEKLSQFFYQRGKYKEAAAACIAAISIYPQQDYMQLLKRIVNKTGKDFNTQWIQRPVYPLTTSKNYFELFAKEKTPWWQYQVAEGDVHSYFDTLGMVRPNDKTNERYLEVYAWKRMLRDTKKDTFQFARAMDKIGYLDCYVLISCFHHDLYGQFADFAKRNPEKIKDYFYILINWEDKKFDKLRKEVAPKK